MTIPPRRFPVTVTRLPVVRCQVCQQTIAYRPGKAADMLTEHYQKLHQPQDARR